MHVNLNYFESLSFYKSKLKIETNKTIIFYTHYINTFNVMILLVHKNIKILIKLNLIDINILFAYST